MAMLNSDNQDVPTSSSRYYNMLSSRVNPYRLINFEVLACNARVFTGIVQAAHALLPNPQNGIVDFETNQDPSLHGLLKK